MVGIKFGTFFYVFTIFLIKINIFVLMSDIRVPLMWNEEEHFRAKESISGVSYNTSWIVKRISYP